MNYVANQWEDGEKLDLDKYRNIEQGVANVEAEKEALENKVWFIDENSTHVEYPSARAVWMRYQQIIGNIISFIIEWYDEDKKTLLYSNTGIYGSWPIYDNPNDTESTIEDFYQFDGSPVEVIYRDMKYAKILPPEFIKIIKLPDKINYTFGEKIDYKGISVQALNKKGEPYGGFPNGIIPFEELIFPIEYAPDDNSTVPTYKKTYKGGGGLTLLVENASPYLHVIFYSYYYHYSDKKIYWPNCLLYSSIQETVRFSASPSTEQKSPIMLNNQYVNDEGVTVYWAYLDYDGASAEPIYGPVTSLSELLTIYGNNVKHRKDEYIDIPVQWKNPRTDDMLEDSFEIVVGG